MKKLLSIAAVLSLTCMGSSLIFPVSAENAEADAAPETMTYDINEDGSVDSLDVIALASHIKGTKTLPPEYAKNADVNGDKKVDSSDLTIIAFLVKGYSEPIVIERETIRQMLIDFIEANKIPAFVYDEDAFVGTGVYDDHIVIGYEWMHEDVEDTIAAFMEENGIDPDLVMYNIAH